LDGVLADFLIWILGVEELDGVFGFHGGPVPKHVVNFIDLDGPVPFDTLEEDWQTFRVSLVMLATLEQVLAGRGRLRAFNFVTLRLVLFCIFKLVKR